MVKKKVTTAPLTFDLGKRLQKKVELYQAKSGLRFKSEIIRQAVSQYDFNQFENQKQDHAQVSVRLPEDLKAKLIRVAKSKKISVGRLIRAAVESLPDQPDSHFSPQNTNTMPAKKNTAKKSVAKKPAAKKAVKKAAAKKVVAKKATAKKAPAKKAVAKKAPAKKAAAKKSSVKKAAAKKPATKKAPAKKKVAAKKAPAKKAPAKKAVKKVAKKASAKKGS